ncbi:hypothetical protein TWF481_010255 [Arthrobotrys musiformis]|uniref:Uncharacterized protein n=1 Tax=Arthrobotrys musiformis TaxID=47236 RepID=A0AAV9W345_9PEZI
MHFFKIAAVITGASLVSGQLVRVVAGTEGASVPGLGIDAVVDGTPRDCIVNACGAQADTAIIRDDESRAGRSVSWSPNGMFKFCPN